MVGPFFHAQMLFPPSGGCSRSLKSATALPGEVHAAEVRYVREVAGMTKRSARSSDCLEQAGFSSYAVRP